MFKLLAKCVLYPLTGVLLFLASCFTLVVSGIGIMELFDLIWRNDVYRVMHSDTTGETLTSHQDSLTAAITSLPAHWSILDGNYEQIQSKLIRRARNAVTDDVRV